jgi:mono/diheme cytochrome c family protein
VSRDEDQMKILAIFAATAALLMVAAIGVAWSGSFDVSAMTPHTAAMNWVLHGIMRRSVQAHATAVAEPTQLAELAAKGAGDFDEMCVQCHGAPGEQPGEVGKGLNPHPPDLAAAARRWTAAELFWIVRNGIRMTGMPAFGPTHDNDRIWAMVAFVRRLPDMTAAQYAKVTSAATGDAHDARQPHDHDHHDHDHAH